MLINLYFKIKKIFLLIVLYVIINIIYINLLDINVFSYMVKLD